MHTPRSKKTMKNAASYLCVLNLIVLAVSGDDVSGLVNGTLTLPCTYIVHKNQHSFCWGRGGCPFSGCSDEIIKSDGQILTWRKSARYQLLGNISQGNVSLTITGTTKEDEGTYCCRVETPGLFNDKKIEENIKIQEGEISTSTKSANSNTQFTTRRPSIYETYNVSYTSMTLTAQRSSFTSQETITLGQSAPPNTTIYVVAGVVGALSLVALMGLIVNLCKHQSGNKTKTERSHSSMQSAPPSGDYSTLSVINMDDLAETGNETIENIYT